MTQLNKEKILNAHKILTEFKFEDVELKQGYANRALRIDLTKNEITILQVTQQMKDLWIGGKGFDLWYMFQEINKNTKWDSNENPICFSSGPLGGTTSFPGSGKSIVTSISPLTGTIIDCNVGGYFGPYLKFAGFDSLIVIGKCCEESIIYIDSTKNRVTIETAPVESVDSHVVSEELTEAFADDELDKRNIAVVSAGRGAQFSKMGVLNFSFYDWRRKSPRLKQAGRGGIGTVLRNKKIKALVIKNQGITPAWNIQENKVTHLTTPKIIPHVPCKSAKEVITSIVEKWENNPEYVIEMMQDVQDRYRHISKTAIDTIAAIVNVPKARLYHIATFYKTFSLDEKGEQIIQVCMGTACHVRGASNILDSFERVLNIKAGETTEDKKYSLEAVACLGACSIAPVVKIGDEILGNVKAKDVKKLLKGDK
jgi:NADH:ubiquinone oxidoreductase subunit E